MTFGVRQKTSLDDALGVVLEVRSDAGGVHADGDAVRFEVPRGPMPDSISSCGVLIAPAKTMTSGVAAMRSGRPKGIADVLDADATVVVELELTDVNVVRTVRFSCSRIGCRYDTDEEARVPSARRGRGGHPCPPA